MAWEKVPEENKDLLANVTAVIPEADKRMMFGCPVYFLNGNMFVGAHQTDIFLRLPPADREELFSNAEAYSFSPKPGMVMKEYVVLPKTIYESELEFTKWLQRSKDYVINLPNERKKEESKIGLTTSPLVEEYFSFMA